MKKIQIYMLLVGIIAIFLGAYGSRQFEKLDELLSWLYIVVGIMFVAAAITPNIRDDAWCARTFGRILVLVAIVIIFFGKYGDFFILLTWGIVSWIVGVVTDDRKQKGTSFLEALDWPFGRT